MTSYKDLFAELGFEQLIRKFCTELGWRISEIDNRHAIIKFNMNSGRVQTLFIVRFETTLEFSVPSGLVFNSENSIPDRVSTFLLKSNSERKIGFWSIETIQKKFVYSIMHNVEIALIDRSYFERVVQVLVNECDKFESGLGK